MSFDARDIRPAMDVFTLDNVYLGTILAIQPEPGSSVAETVGADARQSSQISGELLGPMPTGPLGNTGPSRQSAMTGYGTKPDTHQSLGGGTIAVGQWWGLLGRREIPLRVVQTVSLERVVLRLKHAELDGPLPSEAR